MKAIWCNSCKEALSNDDIALNLRLSGKGTARFYCARCLSQRLGCSSAELGELKEYFKQIGCELFQRTYVIEKREEMRSP